MLTTDSTAPKHRETFQYRGRSFFRLQLRVHDDRLISYVVPRQVADRYEIRDILARGGGGVILVARDLKTEHLVLVKALTEYNLARENLDYPVEDVVDSLRRLRHHLQTERRLLVQLRNRGCNSVPHPNDYVFDANPALEATQTAASGDEWKLSDEGLLTSEPYLVMQHVAGKSLKEVLDVYYRGGLEESVALRIIDQTARVLELLQQPLVLSNGQVWTIVYQDLKAGNIVVDAHGHATLLDFGGCQIEIDGTLVLHGSHSPGYCAPECGRGAKITAAADSYGLGSTLYRMLSGERLSTRVPDDLPPGSSSAVHIDATDLSGKCSPGVVELIQRCVAWEPQNRLQNASEFRRELAALLSWT